MLQVASGFLLYAALLLVSILFSKGGLRNPRESLRQLGLVNGKLSLVELLKQAAALILILFVLLAVEAIALSVFLPGDSDKVAVAISTLPLAAIVLSVTLAPVAEEVFFRGLLQRHVGVVLAALVFALLHFSFGSFIEIAGAFTAGMVLGWWVKYKNPSLWPVIIAHAGYNAISIFLVFA